MNRTSRLALVGGLAAALSLAATLAAPQTAPAQDHPPLPKGMTEADMQACIEAGTPGPMQEQLARAVGTWKGMSTMWMGPEADPVKTECTVNVSSIMDGRYIQCDYSCDMPGMGPFHGVGTKAYDNVAKTFQAVWIDNHSTGIMVGTGTEGDGSSMTWNYTYNCPIAKGPATMREVEHFKGDNSMAVEMYATDPKTGKEYKMMETAYTRQGSKPAAGTR